MSGTDATVGSPGEAAATRALQRFAAEVRRHYGGRLEGLYLFGSRARGDCRPDSDADVAVVLIDSDWDLVAEKRQLARLAYDAIVETAIQVQGWPVSLAAWERAASPGDAGLVANMRRDAKPLVRP